MKFPYTYTVKAKDLFPEATDKYAQLRANEITGE